MRFGTVPASQRADTGIVPNALWDGARVAASRHGHRSLWNRLPTVTMMFINGLADELEAMLAAVESGAFKAKIFSAKCPS